jgi:prepilin-type processing-associated H-X9-DG protein/prepilin-type N-terminal cleavage/methylation domain-containing protein
MNRSAFTLLELVVTVAVILIVAVLSIAGVNQVKPIVQSAYCANSLHQLAVATDFYLNDHQHKFFAYCKVEATGKLWYFGFETYGSLGSSEGDRIIDQTQSPLYPYVEQAGGIQVCPSFPYGQAIWKPKYQGASWGYGFNTFLSDESFYNIRSPSQVLLFGDCAQVNNFQPPAYANHPMLEEFYMIDNTYQTIHFRHGGSANILFLDGHVEKFSMYPGTLDTRLPGANVGRITPFQSMQYLQ